MLRLDLSLAPKWIDVGSGVRLFCAPCTSTIMAEAFGAPDVMAAHAEKNMFLYAMRVSRYIAPRVVRDWEGVGDEAGNPLPVSPEAVLALMDGHHLIATQFSAVFVQPLVAVQDEKNAFAASPNGTSAKAGRSTAPRATGSAKIAHGTKTGRKR